MSKVPVVFLPPPQAADYICQRGPKVATSTLAKMRCLGGGPSFHKAGRLILYQSDSLDEWIIQRIGPEISNTSEYK